MAGAQPAHRRAGCQRGRRRRTYAIACLHALNGLRVSEACNGDVTDLAGSRYQPTLRILGKGDNRAEIVLNTRTWEGIDHVVDGGSEGPLLRNRWGNRMRRHNVTSILVWLAEIAVIRAHLTPHALRHSYITIGLQHGRAAAEMQRAARHTKADTTIGYDQSVRSFHREPTFVLMSATAR